MSDTASKLHGWGHKDYEVAKEHIRRQLGSLDGLEVFGRQVLVAVYTRPAKNERSGLSFTEKEQRNDWYEGKVVLILDHGPDAFCGTDEWKVQTYPGGRVPKVGDWVFQNANTGIQFSFCGDDAERIQYTVGRGEYAVYPGDGWPVRIILDDGFLGRLRKPHTVV